MSGPSEVIHATASAAPAKKRRARWTIVVVFLLIAALLLPLFKLSHYHRTIADSLSRSLGHTVTIGSANFSIIPLPRLVIHDLTVEEDPAFGAEPLLRSPEVAVYLRLSSLWRQRLEISRIDLDNASVNLVRDPSSARWNFSSLLLQASHTATAPTAQRRPGPAPRFPYIEFTAARINFKDGVEKKAFSFLNADASVWLARPDRWEIRFQAQPARTDLELDLEDMGTVRLEGSITRADSLDQLPLDLHAEWTGAQLGQASRIVFGSDSGWRGDLRAEADITGDMRNLILNSRLRVANVHRQEFTPINPLDIDTRCQATYRRPLQSLDNLTCLLPAGDGHLLLTGAVRNLADDPTPQLNLEINHTPIAFTFTLLGLMRSNLSSTLSASGILNGNFSWGPPAAAEKTEPSAGQSTLTGHAVAANVSVQIAGIDQPFTFAALRFTTPDFATNLGAPSFARSFARRMGSHQRQRLSSRAKRTAASEAAAAREALVPGRLVLLEPASFSAGAPTPMQVSAQFTRSGFTLHFTGEAALARLRPITRDLSQLRALARLAPRGTAQSDLTFSGPWIPPLSPEIGNTVPTQIHGWTRLQHAEIRPAWLPEPLEIASATAQIENNSVTWTNAAVSLHGIAAKGSASYILSCDNPDGCPAQLTLDFTSLDAAALQSALLGASHGEFVQAILSAVESPAPLWPALNATIHAATLSIGALKLNNARASIANANGRLKILSFDAAALGGSAHATGSIEPASGGPKYDLDIGLNRIKLAHAAALFHEKWEQWGSGSLDGQLKLALSGYSNLASTAAGEFRWTITGDWTAPTPPDSGSPSIPTASISPTTSPSTSLISEIPSHWSAAGTVSNQTLVLTKGPAQGTIGFDRKLDLDWTAVPGPLPSPVQLLDSSYVDGPLPQSRPRKTSPAKSTKSPTPRAFLRITGTLARPFAAPAQNETASTQPNPRAN